MTIEKKVARISNPVVNFLPLMQYRFCGGHPSINLIPKHVFGLQEESHTTLREHANSKQTVLESRILLL